LSGGLFHQFRRFFTHFPVLGVVKDDLVVDLVYPVKDEFLDAGVNKLLNSKLKGFF
jgi:hypothetical protein